MTHTEILQKMRTWITEQLRKAEQPGGEAFTYTSLTYCAEQVGAGAARQEVIAMLQATAKRERLGKYDVVRPHGAYFLIDRTLAAYN